MDSTDVLVLKRLLSWRQAGLSALLVTVTRTWGSSPRPIGSIMALAAGGQVVGSVSGGCIEDDLIARFADAIPAGRPEVLTYGLSAEEAHRFGLPCGGTLELVLEFQPEVPALAELVALLEQRQEVERQLCLIDGSVRLISPPRHEQLLLEPERLINRFGPAWRLLLIGAGQLAEYLATMAVFSGFSVQVCDPRATYTGQWGGPPAVQLVHGMPDDEVLAYAVDSRTAVVALTHDPKLDDMALLEALVSPAFYVGAIGSRRNQAARRERLAEHFGLTEAQLRKLHGPIGLNIGSKTPAEIAISVMAEIVAVRNGIQLKAPAAQAAQTPEPVAG